jgi:hypothetical protein
LPTCQIGSSKTSLSVPVYVVYIFLIGIWDEIPAVCSNGQILETLLTAPELFQVDPLAIYEPQLLHSLSGHTSLLGIAQTYTDIFYIVAANLTIALPIKAVPGSGSVWRIL